MKRLLYVSVVITAAACGHSSPGGPNGAQLSVGGAYEIRKVTASDTCGLSAPGDVITNPAEVRHIAGSSSFVLNDHGTRDLPGTVNRDGTFTMPQARSVVMNTIEAVDSWDGGRFAVSGFELRNTTDLAANPRGGPACRIVAVWTATKQGAPNVLP